MDADSRYTPTLLDHALSTLSVVSAAAESTQGFLLGEECSDIFENVFLSKKLIESTGKVYAFGKNDGTLLSLGTTNPRCTPTLIVGDLSSISVVAIAAGVYSFFAISIFYFGHHFKMGVILLFSQGSTGRVYDGRATSTLIGNDLSSISVVSASAGAHAFFTSTFFCFLSLFFESFEHRCQW